MEGQYRNDKKIKRVLGDSSLNGTDSFRATESGYLTSQPGSNKVDGYGYVKVAAPSPLGKQQTLKSTYRIRELDDPYYNNIHWRVASPPNYRLSHRSRLYQPNWSGLGAHGGYPYNYGHYYH